MFCSDSGSSARLDVDDSLVSGVQMSAGAVAVCYAGSDPCVLESGALSGLCCARWVVALEVVADEDCDVEFLKRDAGDFLGSG